MISLVPFVDFLILGRDAHYLPCFNLVVLEAEARDIPVITEECIKNLMKNYTSG